MIMEAEKHQFSKNRLVKVSKEFYKQNTDNEYAKMFTFYNKPEEFIKFSQIIINNRKVNLEQDHE